MSLNTFEIMQEIRALESLLNEVDLETGEFVNSEYDIREYIEKLNLDKATKLNNIEDLKIEMNSQIDGLKSKIEKLNNRKKSIEKNIDKLKDLQVLLLNGEKLKTDEYTFSFRTSKSIVVPDEVDPTFPQVKIKYEWDKVGIKKMLDTGVDYSEYGIYFEEKKSLIVK